MSWTDKLFGKREKKQDTHAPGVPTFASPPYDVSFQMEMAKAIEAEKVPAGTLLWIALPLRKNTLYEPCFGVYVDPATYDKLKQASAIQLGFGRGDIPAPFQWVVRIQDPDNTAKTMEFMSEQLPLDDLALVKLQHFLGNMKIFYLYYVSATQSNYVYLSIPSVLKQHIPSLCPELQAKSSPPLAPQAGKASEASDRPSSATRRKKDVRTQQSQLSTARRPIGGVEVGDAYVKCPDGTNINLGDIRDVSAPRILIGVDPSLLPGTIRTGEGPGAAVLIKHVPGVGGRPQDKLVPVSDFDQADEIVKEIQQARKRYKSTKVGGQPSQGRIVVGECENCHRPLRVKAHGVKREMHLTCKCGHVNIIHVPDELLK